MTDVVSAPAQPDVRSDRQVQLKAAGLLVAVLVVVGVVLGPIWAAWSPAGPAGAVLKHGIQADETEAFIGGDGRFALMVLIVGLIAGVATWYVKPLKATRGPYVAIGLAVGGAAGAAATEWVGYLVRGQGSSFDCNSDTGKCITHLPLSVHMHALLLLEAIAAMLVYSLFVAFAVADDLGRPDPNRSTPPVLPPTGWAEQPPPPAPVSFAAPASSPAPPSIGTEGDLQQRWGNGDTAGRPD
jgi:hypothetical protein